jgi:phage-related baseplate assembly protein
MDRLVAPADFEHFARAFAGIAAAQAAVLSADGFRLLHLTVAGLDGQTVPPGSELYENLVKAIDRRRPFGPTVRVDSYRPLPFTVAARLLVERHHDPRVVRDAAERALRDAFAVGRRDFGQAVHRGEIIALLQGVPGVTAVDLDALAPADVPVPAVARRVLPCARARWVGGAALPAEVLVLDRVALSTSGG